MAKWLTSLILRRPRLFAFFSLAKGLTKYIRYNEVSLYWGSFPYILLQLEWGILFVIPRSLSCTGLLNRGSTLMTTALALKSSDIKYCGSGFYFVVLQCTIVREAHFVILFYCMAKGSLLVACKWANQKQNKDIKKVFLAYLHKVRIYVSKQLHLKCWKC